MNTENPTTSNFDNVNNVNDVHVGKMFPLDGNVLTHISRSVLIKNSPSFQEVDTQRFNKLQHYQSLTSSLVQYIIRDMESRILSAANQGYGWTNIFQYFPTNHPLGTESQKYWAGISSDGTPIVSTPENGGVPLILLFNGPKVGEKRSQIAWTVQGFQTVMMELQMVLKTICPTGNIRIYQRWTGRGGYVIEAVWDHTRYQLRIDNSIRRMFLSQKQHC